MRFKILDGMQKVKILCIHNASCVFTSPSQQAWGTTMQRSAQITSDIDAAMFCPSPVSAPMLTVKPQALGYGSTLSSGPFWFQRKQGLASGQKKLKISQNYGFAAKPKEIKESKSCMMLQIWKGIAAAYIAGCLSANVFQWTLAQVPTFQE